MTREEHRQITEFFTLALHGKDVGPPAPMDFEAEAIIRALFVRNPEAVYRITMLAVAQARELQMLRGQVEAAQCRKTWLARLFRKRPRAKPTAIRGVNARS